MSKAAEGAGRHSEKETQQSLSPTSCKPELVWPIPARLQQVGKDPGQGPVCQAVPRTLRRAKAKTESITKATGNFHDSSSRRVGKESPERHPSQDTPSAFVLCLV